MFTRRRSAELDIVPRRLDMNESLRAMAHEVLAEGKRVNSTPASQAVKLAAEVRVSHAVHLPLSLHVCESCRGLACRTT